ncbi:hypothetical protein Hamer_G004208 [Homarus americanus]|uniref:Uncharacterized protein n=1 Tax=Homarus americanus TaxID=6706 RepID=A0A8J5MQ22_HOMAM|nr:hypothetical protein Hamer_G004208 [Homarus americanus]
MSTAAPRSCLKPPLRNPWVAEDGGESSTSSGQHQQQQLQQQQQVAHGAHADAHRVHDVLAHQYATPYQPTTSHPAHSVAHPSLSVALSTHSAAHPSLSVAHPSLNMAHQSHSVSGAHTAVSSARATQVGPHAHTGHGVVHSHTAHSLHSAAHPMPTTAHSVHSVPGTLQQPWVDPQMLWSTPTLPGVASMPGGGGAGGSSGQASTSGGGGWGVPPTIIPQTGAGGWGGGRFVVGGEGSRCERCHYYCFRAAQAVFVAGIVTGFSLLVAGGVFHRQHVAHLQVLVYIGAMVSLVCVVLLVIFCAMNKDHRTRRGVPLRYSGAQMVGGEPETVPLRAGDGAPNPVVVPADLTHSVRLGEGGTNMEILHQTNHSSCMAPPVSHGGCIVGPTNQNVCFVGPASHNAGSVIGSANHGPVNSSEVSHHMSQARHPAQR